MTSTRWTAIFENTCLALNSLLLFLAVFGAQLQLPLFLQVAGRMHPLILHFPIVLLLLAMVWELAVQTTANPLFRQTGDVLLLSAAVGAAVTAVLGLFLAQEGGYDADTLFWHKWSGVAIAFGAWAWYSFRAFFRSAILPGRLFAALSVGILLVAGHQGATLTHGENYLLAPVMAFREKPPVQLEDALVFNDLVWPILEAKCMSCHNAAKSKGGLVMETEALLLKGGKHGSLWDSTAAQLGHLLQRIHLALEEKEHMPPKGKSQLTAQEICILYHWIKSGASFTQKIMNLPETDSLRILAADQLKKVEADPYTFPAADAPTVQKLNNDYRVVQTMAMNSPALDVEFFGVAAFKNEYLRELQLVKEQVVSLNLHKMPVQDADLPLVGVFPNLRKLDLSFTQITGATLGELTKLKALRQVSLSGTAVKAADLEQLRALPSLSTLYLWNTAVTEPEVAALQQQLPNVHLETGFNGEGVVAKLNVAIIESAAQVFSTSTKVHLKNFIHGAVVRYTLDGTLPDSLTSPISTGDSITIARSCLLTTRTFLPGWITSEVATRDFYKSGFRPDSIALRWPPNPDYKGEGAKTLVNQKIGDTDFKTNKWLGYKETNLESLLFFKEPVTLSSVSLSTLVNIGSYILPAAEIQVWGGADPQHLVLLRKLRPEQPKTTGAPALRTTLHCTFSARSVSVLKIVAQPVAKLPVWHPGKGERAWVFVDEVFLE